LDCSIKNELITVWNAVCVLGDLSAAKITNVFKNYKWAIIYPLLMPDLMSLFDAKEVEQLAKTTTAVSIGFGISPNPTKGNLTLTYSDNQDLAFTTHRYRPKWPSGFHAPVECFEHPTN
jgi:hypothetical protein